MKRLIPITILLLALATSVAAQTDTTTEASTTTAATTTAATTTAAAVDPVPQPDAARTRTEFRELLERHPPHVARVLKLDPALFHNASYLAAYPALAAFVAQHPEVPHSPSYYLEGIYVPSDTRPDTAAERIWSDAIHGFSIFIVVSLVASVVLWLIKTAVQHRRWSRLAKVQSEVHTKLMDRFASNEDLLRYIESPAAARFLQTAPFAIDDVGARPAAPLSRILWSVQAGLVLAAAGIGLQVAAINVHQDVAQPLFAFGVLGIAVGVGFVVAAIVSTILSRKLGAWPNATPSAE